MIAEEFLKKIVSFVESHPNGVEFDHIDDCFSLLQNSISEINDLQDFDRKYVGKHAEAGRLFRKKNGRYFVYDDKAEIEYDNDDESEIKIIGRTVFASFLLGAIISAPIQTQANTETVNGIAWRFNINSSANTSEIAGAQNNPAIGKGTSGDIIIPSVLGGRTVTRISDYAFHYCEKISSIVIPDTVTYVGQSAFQWCSKLEKIVVGKSVSSVGQYAFSTRLYYNDPSSLKTIVIRGGRISGPQDRFITDRRDGVTVYVSSKWTLPSTWEGYSVKYYDPIPTIGSAVAKNLTEALYYATDGKLKNQINTNDKYNAFRSWANSVCGTSDMAKRQSVMDSSLAWLSYAIDADSLLTKAPVQGDMNIDRFAPNTEQVKTFDLDISISDISVGDGATAANLAEVFSIEGATTPNGEYSADTVSASFSAMSNGKVRCVAAPKDASVTSFFMRVMMNP